MLKLSQNLYAIYIIDKREMFNTLSFSNLRYVTIHWFSIVLDATEYCNNRFYNSSPSIPSLYHLLISRDVQWRGKKAEERSCEESR